MSGEARIVMILNIKSVVRLSLVLTVFITLLTGCARLEELINPPEASTPAPGSPASSDDQPAGGISASPLDPIPGEEKMKRGEATINGSEVLLLESYPVQARLSLKGTLPTLCHHLRAQVSPPDADSRIQVELYSLYDPDEICIQVLQAFETTIPLGSLPDGDYTVWLNGVQVGKFTQ